MRRCAVGVMVSSAFSTSPIEASRIIAWGGFYRARLDDSDGYKRGVDLIVQRQAAVVVARFYLRLRLAVKRERGIDGQIFLAKQEYTDISNSPDRQRFLTWPGIASRLLDKI